MVFMSFQIPLVRFWLLCQTWNKDKGCAGIGEMINEGARGEVRGQRFFRSSWLLMGLRILEREGALGATEAPMCFLPLSCLLLFLRVTKTRAYLSREQRSPTLRFSQPKSRLCTQFPTTILATAAFCLASGFLVKAEMMTPQGPSRNTEP